MLAGYPTDLHRYKLTPTQTSFRCAKNPVYTKLLQVEDFFPGLLPFNIQSVSQWGAGIAQWLEHRTRD